MLRMPLTAIAVAAGVLGVACPASAHPAFAITQLPLPTAASGPAGIVSGPQDKLWFTEPDAGRIGAISAHTHRLVSQYSDGASGIIAVAGRLWFTSGVIQTPDPAVVDSTLTMASIGELDPTTHAITRYAVPSTDRLPGAAIARAANGDFWTTEQAGLELGILNPRTRAAATFTLPPGGGLTSALGGIVSGPDGDLWITQYTPPRGMIDQVNPVTHAVAEFPLPASAVGATQITVGPDDNLWFVEGQIGGGDAISRLNPTTRTITDFDLPSAPLVADIATGPDGNIWFTEWDAAKIGVLDPTTGAIRVFTINFDKLDSSGSITMGPDGNMWFTEAYDETAPGTIGTITVGSGPQQLATCATTGRGAVRCRLAPVGHPVAFHPGASIAHLTRGGRLYASGSATRADAGGLRLILVPQQRLVSGNYRLALTAAGRTRDETVTLS